MRREHLIRLGLRAAAVLTAVVFLWRANPNILISWRQWLALAILAILVSAIDGLGTSTVHISTPLELGVLVLAGVPVAVVVHVCVVVVRKATAGGMIDAEAIVDESARTILAMVMVWGIQLQGWQNAGVMLAAAVYVLVLEGVPMVSAVRNGEIEAGLASMLVAAQTSSAVLLLVLYPPLLLWGALLVLIVLAIVKYSAELLSRVRDAYQSMLEATVAALEAADPASEGHGVRVSKIAARVGRVLGYRGRQLKTLSRTALLHELAVSHPYQLQESAQLERVHYLSSVVPVLRALQGVAQDVNSTDAVMAYIVHRAAALDAATCRIDRACAARDYTYPDSLDISLVKRVDEALRDVLVQDS